MKKSYSVNALLLIIAAFLVMRCQDNTDIPESPQVVFPSVVKTIWYSETGVPFQYRIQLGTSSPIKEVNFFTGNDGIVFTSDDRIYGYWHSWGEGDGWRGCYKWGTGSDSLWLTDDDQYSDYEKSYSPTIDGIYYPDNSLKAYWKDTYDTDHNRIQRVAIRNIGADSTWFTDDDGPGNTDEWFGGKYYNAEYDNPPPEPVCWFSWTRLIAFDDPGLNLHWFDSDDHANICMIHEFANGGYFCTRETTYNCIDGIAFNGNDVMRGYADYEYFYENSPLDFTGTWTGFYYDAFESDRGTVVFHVTQNGTAITGTGTFHSDNTQEEFTGEVTGMLNGHALTLVCKAAEAPPGDYVAVTSEAYCENILRTFDFKGNLDSKGKGMISIKKGL